MSFLLSSSRTAVLSTKYYSTLKMEAGIVFETLVRGYQNRLDASQHKYINLRPYISYYEKKN